MKIYCMLEIRSYEEVRKYEQCKRDGITDDLSFKYIFVAL